MSRPPGATASAACCSIASSRRPAPARSRFAPAPADVGIAPQRAEAGAGRVDEHAVEWPREGQRLRAGPPARCARSSAPVGGDGLAQQVHAPMAHVAGDEQAATVHRARPARWSCRLATRRCRARAARVAGRRAARRAATLRPARRTSPRRARATQRVIRPRRSARRARSGRGGRGRRLRRGGSISSSGVASQAGSREASVAPASLLNRSHASAVVESEPVVPSRRQPARVRQRDGEVVERRARDRVADRRDRGGERQRQSFRRRDIVRSTALTKPPRFVFPPAAPASPHRPRPLTPARG